MKFNLVDEDWITVLRLDGSSAELSLRECFEQAEQVRRITAELPTQSFAIFRLLLAICYDAIEIEDEYDLEDLRADGLPISQIISYLEQFHERFDLLHPERPFMQVSTLRTAKDEVSGLERLIADVPNGEPFLTTRSGRGLERISFAEAARWLVHCHAFDASGIKSGAVGDPNCKGGKGYPIGPGWSGQIGGLVLHGRSLAETLLFNLVPLERPAEDRPVWALDTPQTEQRSMNADPGPVALLVWQSRRIRLAYDADGVTGLVLAQGDKVTPQNRLGVETMSAWRYSEPQTKKLGIATYMPLKHNPNRAGWRGLPALLSPSPELVKGHEKTLPSATMESLSQHWLERDSVGAFVVEQVGMEYGPQEATVAELVHDLQDLRLSLLSEDAYPVRALVDEAVRLADKCVWELGRLAANLERAAGDYDSTSSNDRGPLADATTSAWSALDAPAREWLSGLDAETDRETAKLEWQRILRSILEQQAKDLLDTCSPVAIGGRPTKYGFMTAAKAESFFRKALREHLELLFEQDKKENLNE